MPLGAILGCMLTGIFIDIMGRKNWILFLVLPCTGGWASMIWAQSVCNLDILPNSLQSRSTIKNYNTDYCDVFSLHFFG